MSDQENNTGGPGATNAPDGPGENLVDEPTGHALDPEGDPNTEWEKSANEQMEESSAEPGDGSRPS